jgi:hypothetical protein
LYYYLLFINYLFKDAKGDAKGDAKKDAKGIVK